MSSIEEKGFEKKMIHVNRNYKYANTLCYAVVVFSHAFSSHP